MSYKNCRKLDKPAEVYAYQNIEKVIYNLDLFNPFQTVYPKNPFNSFSNYLLIEVTDWFAAREDYQNLIEFLVEIKSESFYASAPPFYLLNAIKVSVGATFEEYNHAHVYQDGEGVLKGLGLRKSPETFYYDDTKSWAMVCDVASNVTVVGLSDNIKEIFFSKFFKSLRE